jgi:Flp pilus assembly protein TadD
VAVAATVLVTTALVSGLAAWQRPPYAERQLYRGQAAYRQGKYHEAEAAFSEVLAAQPNRATARFAYARAYQRSDRWAEAMREYRKLIDEAPDGPTSACLAYCLNRQHFHDLAEPCYEKAIARGFAPAAVYNNLGYIYLRRPKQLEQAKTSLDRALDLDIAMQAAWHNRAVYALQMTFRETRGVLDSDLPKDLQALLIQGLQDAETALLLGPATDELHFNIAQLLALTRRKPNWADKALAQLEKATRKGRNPAHWKDDIALRALGDHSRFKALLEQAPAGQALPSARLVDPITE